MAGISAKEKQEISDILIWWQELWMEFDALADINPQIEELMVSFQSRLKENCSSVVENSFLEGTND